MKTETPIAIEERWIPAEPCVIVRAKKTMAEIGPFFRETFPKLFGYAAARTQPKAAFGRYYDWSGELIEFDAGVVTRDALPGLEDIKAGQYGGHKALFSLHVGPYAQVEKVYAALQTHMKEHELQSAGAPYEVYLNSPDEVPESELKTEVYWPIR